MSTDKALLVGTPLKNHAAESNGPPNESEHVTILNIMPLLTAGPPKWVPVYSANDWEYLIVKNFECSYSCGEFPRHIKKR